MDESNVVGVFRLFGMTENILKYIFVILAVCFFVHGDIGDSCETEYSGRLGRCEVDCPIVEEEAQVGIDPTICGYQDLVTPIVCCPLGASKQDNDRINEPEANRYQPNRFSSPNPDPLIFPGESEASNNNLRISQQKCEEYSNTEIYQALPLVTNIDPLSFKVEKCNYNSVALIVGGKPASAGEFPFMALIGFPTENEKWRCGGSLISDRFVLTAAHCTNTRDAGPPTVVRLGELDLSTSNDGSEHQDYDIEQIKVHPNYRFPLKYDDVALIKTKRTVTFTEFIRPACLYTENSVKQSAGVATGWGKIEFAGDTSDKLMKVTLNIYDSSVCVRIYNTDRNLPRGIVSSMLCAGDLSGAKDTCLGDSGGPLLITKGGNQCKFYIIGITSFGKSCGQINTTAVYSKVSSYVDWIEKTIW